MGTGETRVSSGPFMTRKCSTRQKIVIPQPVALENAGIFFGCSGGEKDVLTVLGLNFSLPSGVCKIPVDAS